MDSGVVWLEEKGVIETVIPIAKSADLPALYPRPSFQLREDHTPYCISR